MAKSESLSPLQKWLKHVDDELTPEGVKHLKLGLFSEFTSRHLEVRDIEKPSILYCILLEKCLKNNMPKTLKIFLHVLRGLGSALKGRLLVVEAFGFNSSYQIQDPGVLDLSRMSVNFKFFQCLLKISTNARKVALGEQLMKRFCKERFLNTNGREVDGIPGLFISLHQTQFIASDFTHHLVEALSKYKAWVCLQHLNDYHKSVGLQTMVFINAHPGVFGLSSSFEDAYAEEWSVDVKRHRPTEELDYITAFKDISHANGLGKRSHSYSHPASRAGERMGYDIIESSDADHLIPKNRGKGHHSTSSDSTRFSMKLNLKKGCGCAVAVLLVAVSVLTAVLASILLATLWIHLIRLPHPSKLPIRQASTIILGDFNSFYYDKVYAGIDEKSLTNATRDLNYNIDVYGIQGACVDIHKHGVYNYFDQVVVTEKNISNFIPVYALSGSFFNYQLYGSTSNMSLQNKFVEVCLNKGASYDDGEKLDCVKMPLFKGVGRYEITDPGYFFFTVQSLNGKAEYSLNVSGTIKKIHVSTDEMLGCGLSRSNLTCHIVLPAKGNTYCLLAEFYKLTHHFMLTELDVRVEKTRASHILGISLPPLIVFVLLVCLSGLGIIFIKCVCVYQRNKQSWHMLTYSI